MPYRAHPILQKARGGGNIRQRGVYSIHRDTNSTLLHMITEKKTPSAAVEIERKFIVTEVPPGLDGYPHEAIRQGYLALDPDSTEVRLRQKGDQFYQTVKRGGGLQRLEVEISLTRAQFDALWPMTDGKRVEKVRYDIVHEGHLIELDVYDEALSGLLTAEVEFPSVEASTVFHPPAWLGREITGEKGYKNKNLAVHGLP